MGAAIWSTPQSEILNFPASNFITFFRNHGLLSGLSGERIWRTVDGGSRVYVNKILAKLGSRAIKSCAVKSIERVSNGVNLMFESGTLENFDQVVICSDAPQALKLITQRTAEEQRLLSKFKISQNKVILHSDEALMPRRLKAWSSWNFISPGIGRDVKKPSSVTYWMNRLQAIKTRTPVLVSLNPLIEPDPKAIYREFDYAHPIFNQETFTAQKHLDGIQGYGGIWYAGAWLGYGFHEDGLTAGLRVANALGIRPDWARNIPPDLTEIFRLKAAE